MTAAEDIATPSISQASLLSLVVRRPLGLVAVLYVIVLVAVTIAAPILAPDDPLRLHLDATAVGPTRAHFLGTDTLGRDLLSRVLFGGRATLVGIAYGILVALAIGIPMGLSAGYRRGRFDAVASAVSDLLMSIPAVVILLSVLAVLPQRMDAAMVVFGVLASAPMFRIVRGATLDVSRELYVTAARLSGLSTLQILRRDVAPRIGPVLVVQASIIGAIALVVQTGMAFLGLGDAPPTPSWGGMVSEAATVITSDPWMMVPPAAAIGITVLALATLGDVVQDVATDRTGRPSVARMGRRTLGATAPSSSVAAAGGPVGRDTLLSVRGLSVGVGDVDAVTWLIQDVSFDIRRGETLGLVGESGAGKSITARALLGLYPAEARVDGSIWWQGVDLVSLPERERHAMRGSQIAFVSQEPMASLDPAFRTGNVIAEAVGHHRGIGRRQAWAAAIDLLRAVRIPDPEEVARKYPHEISGGMAQRAAVALALAGEPRLLIADEPTTALDVVVQAEILGMLRDLQDDRGLAVLLVTHDWGIVADVCDRAVTMYAGEVVESAPVRSIFARPMHPYTTALRRSDPHLQAVSARLEAIPGDLPRPGMWPNGCRFADRCAMARPSCGAGAVPLVVAGPDHQSRCLYAELVS